MELLNQHLQQVSKNLSAATKAGSSTDVALSAPQPSKASQILWAMTEQGVSLTTILAALAVDNPAATSAPEPSYEGLDEKEVKAARTAWLCRPDARLHSLTFAVGMAEIGSNWGIDYSAVDPDTNEPTADKVKALALWDILRADGWTNQQFKDQQRWFVKRVKFPNWSIAEFFGESGNGADSTARVYPHSWYLTQIQANKLNAQAIGTYRVEGYDKPVWGWKHEVGSKLPAWSPATPEPPRPEPPRPELPPLSEGATETITSVRRALELSARLEEAEEALHRMRKKHDDVARERDILRRELSAVNARIAELEAMLLGDLPDESALTTELNEGSPSV